MIADNLRSSYNGITLASQARDAGSTPVDRLMSSGVLSYSNDRISVKLISYAVRG